jgi:hypothetical protein
MILVLAFGFIPASLAGQALEPRLYSNIPLKLNFIALGYAFTQGDVLVDPSVPLEDANLKIHMPIFAYVRSLNVAGRSGKFDIVVPFAWMSGSARFTGDEELTYREISGFADPAFRFTVNLYGAPALSLKDFMQYRQKSIVGVSFQVIAPWGQYDGTKLANVGTNRWTFKPEIGFSQAVGRMILEASVATSFYTTNTNFWGGNVRRQNPIVSLQGHGIYTFKSGVWAALDVTYYSGGRTTLNDTIKNDLQTNWRSGLTLALPISRRNSLKLYASMGLYTRTGNAFNILGVIWQFRWGGGV